MHFTATLLIPPTASEFKSTSINGNDPVERNAFTADLIDRLRTL